MIVEKKDEKQNMRPFREHHLLQLLEEYDLTDKPLDLCMRDYFRSHRSLGSKDRAEISELAYGMTRWLAVLENFAEGDGWDAKLEVYRNLDEFDRSDLPPHLQVSFPKELYDQIIESHGETDGYDLCLACNERAPTTVRANRMKTDRNSLLKKWNKLYDISACDKSEDGILFNRKINFFELEEFKQGFFEIQDEGSQLLAGMVQAEPGEHVMDYCAGSGGKTLAFAPQMQNRGQIYLHDIREWVLDEAKKRLRRAGIQNAQFVKPESQSLKKLKQKMDWVMADVPCSGTGTLRRNPDMKWKYDKEMLERLVGQQRMIFEKALSFVKPGGRIVYGTCSLLKEENQEQIEHFLKTYPVTLEGDPFQCLPISGGMDGFFGAVFRRNTDNEQE